MKLQGLCLLSCLYFCEAARIMFVEMLPLISHHRVLSEIVKELFSRGHHVVSLTYYPENDRYFKNLTEIDLSHSNINKSFFEDYLKNATFTEAISKSRLLMEQIADETFSNPEVKQLLTNKNNSFDLVIVEFIHPIYHAFGMNFNCPIVGVRTLGAGLSTQWAIGNPTHPLFLTDILTTNPKNLYEKLILSYNYLWYYWHHHYVMIPRSDKVVRKHFGSRFPSLGVAEKDTSLVIVNNNQFFAGGRPAIPSLIMINFMTIKPTKILPLDLKEIMDNSPNGVVYMSIGSTLKSSNLTPQFLQLIVRVLSSLPYTVLWKMEIDHEIYGSNVYTRRWFPQQDVLAHPNLKVFVTQGGLHSIEEAFSRGVPMVGMPFIADQHVNVQQIDEVGAGKLIDWRSVTETEFRNAILEVAECSKYKEKVEEIRNYAFDQPMTGREKAVWWIEYVIRHKGAKHLKSVLVDVPMWEYLMLDVLSLMIMLLLCVIFLAYKTISLTTIKRNKRKLKTQ